MLIHGRGNERRSNSSVYYRNYCINFIVPMDQNCQLRMSVSITFQLLTLSLLLLLYYIWNSSSNRGMIRCKRGKESHGNKKLHCKAAVVSGTNSKNLYIKVLSNIVTFYCISCTHVFKRYNLWITTTKR